MALKRDCRHYTIVADYEDKDHEELVLKFIAVFRERTESWGFYDTGERLGRSHFDQLQENLKSTSVTFVVILPNHDERNHVAQYDCQTVLMKKIKNKDKMLIPICLKGGKSEHFEIYTNIEFQGEEDWLEKKEEWDKIRTALQEAECQPASKRHADTKEASLEPADDSKFITEHFLCNMAYRIGVDWWKLGIRLGLEPHVISEIESDYRGQCCMKVIVMLRRWKQSIDTDSEQERVAILCRALRAEKINDLANYVHILYKEFSKDSSTLKTNPAEIERSLNNAVFLLELALRLLVPDWHSNCLLLDVDGARLHCLKQDYVGDCHRQAFQALVIWRSKAGDLSNDDKMEELTNVFQQAGRMEILKWIKGAGPVYMSSDDWKKCFRKNTEDGIKKLLDFNIVLDQPTLEFACSEIGRQSDAIKAVCERICALLKDRRDVTKAWPAYAYKKGVVEYEGKVTFVVVTKNIQLFYGEGYIEGYSCYVRSANKIDDKCKAENDIIKQEERERNVMRNLQDVKECIKMENMKLIAEHKHCERITPSPLKSTGYSTGEHKLCQQKCVALYVHIKGYIPLDEEPFPPKIGDFDVDVREGLYE